MFPALIRAESAPALLHGGGSQKADSPVKLIAAADGDFISFETAHFETHVQKFYLVANSP